MPTTMDDVAPSLTGRRARRAREAAFQMLYQSHVGGASVDQVPSAFWSIEASGPDAEPDVQARADALFVGATTALDAVDQALARHTEHWRPSRLALVDRSILRLAAFELLYTDTPRAVVINEAIELAKRFSSEASAGFINGVLDAVAGHVPEPAEPDALVPGAPAAGWGKRRSR